jgi:hypothetical protein
MYPAGRLPPEIRIFSVISAERGLFQVGGQVMAAGICLSASTSIAP